MKNFIAGSYRKKDGYDWFMPSFINVMDFDWKNDKTDAGASVVCRLDVMRSSCRAHVWQRVELA